jgi:hypothetical protein
MGVYVTIVIRTSSRVFIKECLVISTTFLVVAGRFQGSEPTCHAEPGVDGICRPGQLPTNTTIYGMDGKTKYTVTNVYLDVCPCGQHLSCDPHSGGVCKKST